MPSDFVHHVDPDSDSELFADAIEALPPVKRRRVAASPVGTFPFALDCAHDANPSSSSSFAAVAAAAVTAPDETKCKLFVEALAITEEEAMCIANYTQGTPEWLKSRVGRITASNFGAAMGLNKFMSPRSLLKQLLWGGFVGNAATRWGQEHEAVARDEYIATKLKEFPSIGDDEDPATDIHVEETGLVINTLRPWMGNSPDGIVRITHRSGVTTRGLLEIKCPFKKTFYEPTPVPVYYYCQIQGTMGNLNLPWCDFVVWTPTGLQITRVPFDQAFWEKELLPKVSRFYFEKYVPLAVLKQEGLLATNQIDVAVTVDVNVACSNLF
jgi:hypothetical protein